MNSMWTLDFNHQQTASTVKLVGMRKPTNDAEMQALKTDQQISAIISLLEDTENHELYKNNDMDFLWLPVKGGGTPNREQVETAYKYITDTLNDSATAMVATHCNGGRKRTGTLLAGVLILNGVAVDTAINMVETANPEITLTQTQREFLHTLT